MGGQGAGQSHLSYKWRRAPLRHLAYFFNGVPLFHFFLFLSPPPSSVPPASIPADLVAPWATSFLPLALRLRFSLCSFSLRSYSLFPPFLSRPPRACPSPAGRLTDPVKGIPALKDGRSLGIWSRPQMCLPSLHPASPSPSRSVRAPPALPAPRAPSSLPAER